LEPRHRLLIATQPIRMDIIVVITLVILVISIIVILVIMIIIF
jgi:hypothetical protein